jgi:hypothetical protein
MTKSKSGTSRAVPPGQGGYPSGNQHMPSGTKRTNNPPQSQAKK